MSMWNPSTLSAYYLMVVTHSAMDFHSIGLVVETHFGCKASCHTGAFVVLKHCTSASFELILFLSCLLLLACATRCSEVHAVTGTTYGGDQGKYKEFSVIVLQF